MTGVAVRVGDVLAFADLARLVWGWGDECVDRTVFGAWGTGQLLVLAAADLRGALEVVEDGVRVLGHVLIARSYLVVDVGKLGELVASMRAEFVVGGGG